MVESSPVVPSNTLPLADAALEEAAELLPVVEPLLSSVDPGVRGMAGLM